MSPAEREAIRAAGREVAKGAPPLPAEVLEMLRGDACPAIRKSAAGAA